MHIGHEVDLNENDLQALRRVIACGAPERNAPVLREIVRGMWNRYLMFENLRRRKAVSGIMLDPMEPLHSLFTDPLAFLARDLELNRLWRIGEGKPAGCKPELATQHATYKVVQAVIDANPGTSIVEAATALAAVRHPGVPCDFDLHVKRYVDAHAKFRERLRRLEPYAFLFHGLVVPGVAVVQGTDVAVVQGCAA